MFFVIIVKEGLPIFFFSVEKLEAYIRLIVKPLFFMDYNELVNIQFSFIDSFILNKDLW